MFGLALRTVTLPAATYQFCGRSAVRTKTMARVPMQHSLRLRDRGQVVGRDKALHRNRAQVGHMQFLPRLPTICCLSRNAMAEPRFSIEQPQEDHLRGGGERLRLAHAEEGLVYGRTFLHHDPIAAYDVDARLRITCQRSNGSRIDAEFCRAVDTAIGISETGFGAEIWARVHASCKFARSFHPRNAYSRLGRGYIASRSSGRCHCGPSTPCLAP